MVSQSSKAVRLDCVVQHYAWGSDSTGLVARLSHNTATDKPCAELWMGTHPSGPSAIHSANFTLTDYLGGRQLPFLFKVLSVKTALSIQAHPDKQLATQLHASNPKNYPDDNHKPEMAIALTPFEALCSFRPQADIIDIWQRYPPLSFITVCDDDIKLMFAKVMQCNGETAQMVSEKLHEMAHNTSDELLSLFTRLWSQYPNDVGCFCVFLLNYLQLQPSEAIFLPANEPHAYLKGDLVECMANSDNVVRAGLTPKFRDLETLLKMLTYRQIDPLSLLIKPEQIADKTMRYLVPVEEFAVALADLEGSGDRVELCFGKDAILIIITGTGSINEEQYQEGHVYYLPPKSTTTLSSQTASKAFIAYQP